MAQIMTPNKMIALVEDKRQRKAVMSRRDDGLASGGNLTLKI